MKVAVAELCGEYDAAQKNARFDAVFERRDGHWKVVSEKRDEIAALCDAERGLLALGCSPERAAEASAELSYFAAWLSRRGGWVG